MHKTSFMKDHCFFNNNFMMVEMVEEWKNNTFIPVHEKVYKQKVETHKIFSLLNVCCQIL